MLTRDKSNSRNAQKHSVVQGGAAGGKKKKRDVKPWPVSLLGPFHPLPWRPHIPLALTRPATPRLPPPATCFSMCAPSDIFLPRHSLLNGIMNHQRHGGFWRRGSRGETAGTSTLPVTPLFGSLSPPSHSERRTVRQSLFAEVMNKWRRGDKFTGIKRRA